MNATPPPTPALDYCFSIAIELDVFIGVAEKLPTSNCIHYFQVL